MLSFSAVATILLDTLTLDSLLFPMLRLEQGVSLTQQLLMLVICSRQVSSLSTKSLQRTNGKGVTILCRTGHRNYTHKHLRFVCTENSVQ